MNLNQNSNVNSKRGKHTAYARWTSIMRKLSNEIEGEKQRAKSAINDK
jgi:hypothetical protein